MEPFVLLVHSLQGDADAALVGLSIIYAGAEAVTLRLLIHFAWSSHMHLFDLHIHARHCDIIKLSISTFCKFIKPSAVPRKTHARACFVIPPLGVKASWALLACTAETLVLKYAHPNLISFE